MKGPKGQSSPVFLQFGLTVSAELLSSHRRPSFVMLIFFSFFMGGGEARGGGVDSRHNFEPKYEENGDWQHFQEMTV